MTAPRSAYRPSRTPSAARLENYAHRHICTSAAAYCGCHPHAEICTLNSKETAKSVDEEELLQFIRGGESELTVGGLVEEAVLVLWNTGAGKTTFTQWIAGDNSKLISEDVGRDGNHEFIIEDNNRIEKSTLTPKTVFPELVVDNDTHTAYYDVSGFSDTRTIKHDIPTSYFIKRIISRVQRIKIVLAVSHSSVRTGADRKDFMQLLTHVTELIKNIDNYEDSIALVVTKFEDFGQRVEGSADENEVMNVAGFLMKTIEDLQATAYESDSEEEISVYKNNMKVIASLLTKEGPSYNRIALFRRPNMEGPLDKICLLKNSKKYVKGIVSDLKYVVVEANDFSFSISDKINNKINSLFEIMELNIVGNVKRISKDLLAYYEGIMAEIKTINFFNEVWNTTTIDPNIKSLEKHTNTVKKGFFDVSKLEHELKHIQNPVEIAGSLKNALEILKLDVSHDIILDITAQANFMEFLRESSHRVFTFGPNRMPLAMQELIKYLEEMLKVSESKYKNLLSGFVLALRHSFETEEEDLRGIAELNTNIKPFYEKLTLYKRSTDEVQLKEVLKIFSTFNVSLSDYTEYTVQNLLREKKYSEYFKNDIASTLVDYLQDSFKWYKFTNALYLKLSQYEVQNKRSVGKNCIDILQRDVRYGVITKFSNIYYYLENCDEDFVKTEYENVVNVIVTEHRIRLLKHVVNQTVNFQLTQTCNVTQLVVKGRFVKLNDVNFEDCPNARSIEIFALEKVFIDVDLKETSKNLIQMSIIAPIWEIIGKREFILNGFKGKAITPAKAPKEEDGKPGNPGTNGRNFVGFGNVFINGHNLFISANGGDGGAGQKGGDGRSGHDGTIPELPYRVVRYGLLATKHVDNVHHWRKQGFQVSEGTKYHCYVIYFCRDFTVKGERCTNGGDGGRGGKGGFAGLAGKILISNAPFKISAKNGIKGKSGSPGLAGSKGVAAATITVQEKHLRLLKKYKYRVESKHYHKCLPGHVDHETNDEGRVRPKKVKDIKLDVWDKYKTYLKQNINELHEDASFEFLNTFEP